MPTLSHPSDVFHFTAGLPDSPQAELDAFGAELEQMYSDWLDCQNDATQAEYALRDAAINAQAAATQAENELKQQATSQAVRTLLQSANRIIQAAACHCDSLDAAGLADKLEAIADQLWEKAGRPAHAA